MRVSRELEYFAAVRQEVRVLLGVPPHPEPLTRTERARIVPSLRRQVDAFTTERSHDGRSHLSTDVEVAAYLAYYGVRSFMVVRRFAEDYALDGRRVLDLGAGPGSAAFAICEPRDAGDLVLVERQERALNTARSLAVRLRIPTPRLERRSVEELAWPGRSFSTVVAANTINEWTDDVMARVKILRRAADSLMPGGRLLIVEPAMRGTARALSTLRDQLIAAGLGVEGPCTHIAACPLLARRRDYCHGRLELDVPEDFAALGVEASGVALGDADFASLIVGKGATPRADGLRVIGDVRREKGRDRLFLCGAEGMVECYALTGRGALARGSLRVLRRGDIVDLSDRPARSPLRLDDPGALRCVGRLP